MAAAEWAPGQGFTRFPCNLIIPSHPLEIWIVTSTIVHRSQLMFEQTLCHRWD